MKIMGIDSGRKNCACVTLCDQGKDGILLEHIGFWVCPDVTMDSGNVKKMSVANLQMYYMAEFLLETFDESNPDAVAVEGIVYIPPPPPGVSSGRTVSMGDPRAINQSLGVVKGILFGKGIIPLEYSSSEAKKHVLGKRAGTKEEIEIGVTSQITGTFKDKMPKTVYGRKNGPIKEDMVHIYDAAAIALCAVRELRQQSLFLKKQK